MAKKYFLILLLFVGQYALAQKEGWNWYFGNHAGISFKNGVPEALNDGMLSTWEGVAAISDVNGKLLFYTDGSTVYNAQNRSMPNGLGLFGNSSSSQSAIIVKKPGSQILYYIFTVDSRENFPGKGLNYSMVDISLDNGLGDVTQKNSLLQNSAIEKLSVARHKNNTDFWILINDWQEDDIFSYKLSCNGIDGLPVKSKIGPFHHKSSIDLPGYLKVSRQNNKLALAIAYNNSFVVMDYDNSTGKAFNRKDIVGNANTFGTTYGVEFSPDGNLLYGTTLEKPKLMQFNLNAGTGLNMYNSRILLATHNTIRTFNYYYYGALQLGPDGKIYSANNGDTSLGVINSPNVLGISCNYINNVVSLNGKISYLGLPNYLTDYILPIPRDTIYAHICANQKYTLPDSRVADTPGIYISQIPSIDVCDSTVITKLSISPEKRDTINITICEDQSYLGYTTSGTYNDTLISWTGCDSIRTLNLTVKSKSFLTINQSICEGQSYLGYRTTGTFIDSFIGVNGCDSIRTLNLTVNPKVLVVVNQRICQGQVFLGYTSSGNYIDTFRTTRGCDSIRTLNLTVNRRSFSTISKTICEGESYLGYTVEGVFTDTLVAVNSCDSIRTLALTVSKKPLPDLGIGKGICRGDTIVLSPGQFLTYLWQDGSTRPVTMAYQPGTYDVTVTNSCGSAKAQVVLTAKDCAVYFSTAFTPNKDSKNDLFKVLNATNFQTYHLIIYNRWGQVVFETKDYTKGWDGNFQGIGQPSGAYIWFCEFDREGRHSKQKGTIMLLR